MAPGRVFKAARWCADQPVDDAPGGGIPAHAVIRVRQHDIFGDEERVARKQRYRRLCRDADNRSPLSTVYPEARSTKHEGKLAIAEISAGAGSLRALAKALSFSLPGETLWDQVGTPRALTRTCSHPREEHHGDYCSQLDIAVVSLVLAFLVPLRLTLRSRLT